MVLSPHSMTKSTRKRADLSIVTSPHYPAPRMAPEDMTRVLLAWKDGLLELISLVPALHVLLPSFMLSPEVCSAEACVFFFDECNSVFLFEGSAQTPSLHEFLT